MKAKLPILTIGWKITQLAILNIRVVEKKLILKTQSKQTNMKKSLIGSLALLAGATVTYGQGAVSLGNFSALNTYIYVSYKATSVALGGTGSGDPAASMSNYAQQVNNGADWTVALYGASGAGLPSSSLSALPGETATFADGLSGSGHNNVAGTWLSTAVYTLTPSTSPTTMTVQLYAWYNDGGTITSYSQALADNVPVGSSAPANVVLNFPPNSPASLPAAGLGNFTVTTTVPEPSTIALGVMGASAFLMRLRRKQ
jgi:hypothetical protein